MAGHDRGGAQRDQLLDRSREVGRERRRADEGHGPRHEVAGEHDPLRRQVHHEIAARVATPEPAHVQRAPGTLERQPIRDLHRRPHRPERRDLRDVLLRERDAARVTRALLIGERLTVETPALLEQSAQERDRAGTLLGHLPAVRCAVRREVLPGGRVRNDLRIGERVAPLLQADYVVVVPVRRDQRLHRPVRQRAQRRQKGVRRRRVGPAIDDDDLFGADHEAGVRLEHQAGRVRAYQCVDAVGNPLHVEAGPLCRLLCVRSNGREQDECGEHKRSMQQRWHR